MTAARNSAARRAAARLQAGDERAGHPPAHRQVCRADQPGRHLLPQLSDPGAVHDARLPPRAARRPAVGHPAPRVQGALRVAPLVAAHGDDPGAHDRALRHSGTRDAISVGVRLRPSKVQYPAPPALRAVYETQNETFVGEFGALRCSFTVCDQCCARRSSGHFRAIVLPAPSTVAGLVAVVIVYCVPCSVRAIS